MKEPPKLFVLAARRWQFREWRINSGLPTYAAIHLENPLPLPYEAVAYVVDLGANYDDPGQRRAVKAVDRLDLLGRVLWCTPDDVEAVARGWRVVEARPPLDLQANLRTLCAEFGV